MDFVLNQFLSEKFAIGINGLFYRQLSSGSGAGALLGDFKGEAAGVGPEIKYVANLSRRDVASTAKWIAEFDTKNRLDADHVFALFAMSF